jgi:integrase
MPKRTPKYALHKPSGQARVRIDGKNHYLGIHNSPESQDRYENLVSKWFAGTFNADRESLSLDRLSLLYLDHCRVYYVKDSSRTSEVYATQAALRPLIRLFGKEKVSHFGPMKLKRVRNEMISQKAARSTINGHVQRIVRMLKWGVENELVDATVYQSCKAVSGLRRGRSEARDTDPVKPVPQVDIDAVELFVSREVWGMIQLQLCTGMRPGEVCILRARDLDRSGDVWTFTPETHKTAHHGRQRLIFIGPKGQEILRPFLSSTDREFVFSPANAEAVRNELKRASRKSPMTPSQAARTPKDDPQWSPGQGYRRDSYSRAISRACKLAKVPEWAPNRLRHNAATALRKTHGLDGTRTVLGHSTTDMTEIYAEIDFETARKIMRSSG